MREHIRIRTHDGIDLVNFAVDVLQGNITRSVVDHEGRVHELSPEIKDRQKAMEWLADRGFGKVSQAIEHNGSLPVQVVVQTISADQAVAGVLPPDVETAEEPSGD